MVWVNSIILVYVAGFLISLVYWTWLVNISEDARRMVDDKGMDPRVIPHRYLSPLAVGALPSPDGTGMKYIDIEHTDGHKSSLPVHHINFMRKGAVLMVVGPEKEDTFFPLLGVRCWSFRTVDDPPERMKVEHPPLQAEPRTTLQWGETRLRTQPSTPPSAEWTGGKPNPLAPGRYHGVLPSADLEGQCTRCGRFMTEEGCIKLETGPAVHLL